METDMLDEHDHRNLGQSLDLFHMQEEAPGMVFWHPRGYQIFRIVEEAVRRQMARQGFREVRTPQILRQSIWETSGHWQHFSADMFVFADEDRAAAAKPVSCPGHLQIVERLSPSYRDLPLRLGELGLVHRNEASGTLHGLFRLRQFTQDDGHIFCEEGQIEDEVAQFCGSLRSFYAAFGFADVAVGFSTRPALRAGSDATWDRAEAMLRAAADRAGLACVEQPGQGAFYGPKLEFVLQDRLGRAWQCGTIQLDLVLPERFGVRYVDASGARRPPAMLHRATLGSVERFLGILLEHHEGALPAWLAPDQAVVAPVAEAHRAHAERVVAALRAASVRASLDARSETLARRVVDAHAGGVPFLLVVGGREVQRGAVTVRDRQGGQRELPLDAGVAEVARACAAPV
jgi:threonyl-tRNA synthetase